jgi:HK97 family phage major capsid protein
MKKHLMLLGACLASFGRYAYAKVMVALYIFHQSHFAAYDMPADLQGELKKLEEALSRKSSAEAELLQKALKDESEKYGTISAKTNEKIAEISAEAKAAQDAVKELRLRATDLEQKLAKRTVEGGTEQPRTAGQRFVEAEDYKTADFQRCREIKAVEVGPLFAKTAVLNALGQNQPLVPDQRVPGIITAANRRLTIRDLLPQLRTSSNLVQFASESSFTNNAGIQFSSPDSRENVAKGESALAFTLSNAAVETIAHWIPASRQILADATGLADYIDSRLTYGLKLKEETQFLSGDGSAGSLNGLYTQATAYNRGVSNDTMLDCLLKAKLQVAISEYEISGYVLNPIDWTTIMLLKDTTGRYLFTNPQEMAAPRLWGAPVVSTNSMTAGTFLAGAFDLAAAIWDREDASVRVAEQHDDFFVKNMVAILCEERTTLTVYRTTALVKGSLPTIGT